MTILKFINMFLLQWFFVRLTKHYDSKRVLTYFSIQGFIMPTTGWNSEFKYISKGPKFFRLTGR